MARPRKNAADADDGGDPNGDGGDGKEKAGWDGVIFECSEVNEGDLEEIGTVKLVMLIAGDEGPASLDSSGGVASGGGIGKPLAAAMI